MYTRKPAKRILFFSRLKNLLPFLRYRFQKIALWASMQNELLLLLASLLFFPTKFILYFVIKLLNRRTWLQWVSQINKLARHSPPICEFSYKIMAFLRENNIAREWNSYVNIMPFRFIILYNKKLVKILQKQSTALLL
jgi:hypothetical protein